MRHRRPVQELTASGRSALIAAFRALSESSDAESNYTFWASIHASCCPHKSALFLPWHRAYLFAFEDALRAAVNDAALTLPYWDWIATPSVPDIAADLVPFAEKYSAAFRSENGRRLPTGEEIDDLLALPYFRLIGGSNCNPQEGGGRLEDRHGLVHTWTGPLMNATRTAAFDPVFWLHHANVDRLWARWQQTHGGQHPPCLTRTLAGIPGDWSVADVQDTNTDRLGYDYVGSVVEMNAAQLRQDAARLIVPIESWPAASAALRLAGIRHAGSGPAPAELCIAAPGTTEPCVRVSLFGLSAASDQQLSIAQTAGCGDAHAAHEGLTLVVDVDLSRDFGNTPPRGGLELSAAGTRDSSAFPLSIQSVAVLFRS